VGCSYSTNAAQSIPDVTVTKLLFEDIEYDSHSAYAAGNYVVPVSGKYACYQLIALEATTTFNGTEIFDARIFINDTEVARKHTYPTSSSTIKEVDIYKEIDVVKGQIISFRTRQNSGGALPLIALNTFNYMSIKKIG
jgi:hypothetical protein